MDTNTTIDQIFPSRWIKSSDIGSNPKIATISKIEFELVGQDQEKKAVVSFQNTTKRLILNKTNAQILANLYGKEVMSWVGKRITLYCAEVQYRGTPCLAVRIKEEVPGTNKAESKPAAAAQVSPPDDEQPWPESGESSGWG
jgi:hypothetical protein